MSVGAGEIANFGFFKLGALLEDTEKEITTEYTFCKITENSINSEPIIYNLTN